MRGLLLWGMGSELSQASVSIPFWGDSEQRAYGLYALGRKRGFCGPTLKFPGAKPGHCTRLGSVYRGEGNRARVSKGLSFHHSASPLYLAIIFSAVLFNLAGIIAERLFDKPDLTYLLQIFALILPFYIFIGIATAVAQSFRRIDYEQTVTVCQVLLNLSLGRFGVPTRLPLGWRNVRIVNCWLYWGVA